MKKTLLVDTNRAAVPIYSALCDMKHEVWVVGNSPGEPLAKLAPHYKQLDYSNVGQLADFVAQKGFDYIVPGCTDLSYQVCTEINDGRFPGIDTPANASAINSKREFRKIAANLDLPIPRTWPISKVDDKQSVIVKPIDSFSGRGMTVLHHPSPDEIARAFKTACNTSKTGNALIEEFIKGQLFSHSAFICNGEVIADFVVQEDCTINPFTVDTSRMALNFPVKTLKSLRNNICRFVASLNLTDGLMHTQFIISQDRYWIIEITRRCPGDLYSLLIELSTGYHYAANYVAPFLGNHASPRNAGEIQKKIIRHTATCEQGISLWGYSFSLPVDIKLFVPLASAGDHIEASPYGRVGIFFFNSLYEKTHEKLYKKIIDKELYSLI